MDIYGGPPHKKGAGIRYSHNTEFTASMFLCALYMLIEAYHKRVANTPIRKKLTLRTIFLRLENAPPPPPSSARPFSETRIQQIKAAQT